MNTVGTTAAAYAGVVSRIASPLTGHASTTMHQLSDARDTRERHCGIKDKKGKKEAIDDASV